MLIAKQSRSCYWRKNDFRVLASIKPGRRAWKAENFFVREAGRGLKKESKREYQWGSKFGGPTPIIFGEILGVGPSNLKSRKTPHCMPREHAKTLARIRYNFGS